MKRRRRESVKGLGGGPDTGGRTEALQEGGEELTKSSDEGQIEVFKIIYD